MNLSFLAGIILTLVPFIASFRPFFGTAALNLTEIIIAVGCALAIIPLVEIQKLIEWGIKRRKQKKIAVYKEEQDNEAESQN